MEPPSYQEPSYEQPPPGAARVGHEATPEGYGEPIPMPGQDYQHPQGYQDQQGYQSPPEAFSGPAPADLSDGGRHAAASEPPPSGETGGGVSREDLRDAVRDGLREAAYDGPAYGGASAGPAATERPAESSSGGGASAFFGNPDRPADVGSASEPDEPGLILPRGEDDGTSEYRRPKRRRRSGLYDYDDEDDDGEDQDGESDGGES